MGWTLLKASAFAAALLESIVGISCGAWVVQLLSSSSTTVPLVQLLSCAVRQKSALESRQREKMTASANARVGTRKHLWIESNSENNRHRGGCAVSSEHRHNLKEANECNTTSTMWTTIREGSFEAGMVPHIWSSRWSRENSF